MKKLPPWQFFLLVIWPYVALAANVLLIQIALPAWLCGMVSTAIVTIVGIRQALRHTDANPVLVRGMRAKLLHIPAYLLSAVLALMLWMAPPLILAMLATNLCMLAATSAYTLRGVYLAWRSGKLTTGRALVLAATQCIFVLDVPGSLIAHCMIKEKKEASPC